MNSKTPIKRSYYAYPPTELIICWKIFGAFSFSLFRDLILSLIWAGVRSLKWLDMVFQLLQCFECKFISLFNLLRTPSLDLTLLQIIKPIFTFIIVMIFEERRNLFPIILVFCVKMDQFLVF